MKADRQEYIRKKVNQAIASMAIDGIKISPSIKSKMLAIALGKLDPQAVKKEAIKQYSLQEVSSEQE